MKKRKVLTLIGDVVGMVLCLFIFVTPFLYMFLNSIKNKKEANLMSLALPTEIHFENYLEVLKANNYMLITAFKNSLLIAFFSVAILILVGSMAGYVLQRRTDKTMTVANALIMSGLMVPPAILPTIWVLQGMHIYKTLFGMITVEVALCIPFTIMLYRGFMGTIPKELEEAGLIDGCSPFQIFTKIVFPLLKPVTSTVIILNAVNIFNDFTNPLYFLPGNANATVQLTLYNFKGKYESSYNLMFADVLVITIPMLILFIFFNKKIIDGMVAGAVKG